MKCPIDFVDTGFPLAAIITELTGSGLRMDAFSVFYKFTLYDILVFSCLTSSEISCTLREKRDERLCKEYCGEMCPVHQLSVHNDLRQFAVFVSIPRSVKLGSCYSILLYLVNKAVEKIDFALLCGQVVVRLIMPLKSPFLIGLVSTLFIAILADGIIPDDDLHLIQEKPRVMLVEESEIKKGQILICDRKTERFVEHEKIAAVLRRIWGDRCCCQQWQIVYPCSTFARIFLVYGTLFKIEV